MADSVLQISVTEFCEREDVSEQVVVTIVEYGIASPISGPDRDAWVFDTASARWMKKALRLRRDLELDWVAVAMVVDLLRRQIARGDNRRHKLCNRAGALCAGAGCAVTP